MQDYILDHYWLFYLLQWTWNILINIFGACVALVMLLTGHKPQHIGPYIYFICGQDWGGMDCGMFFVVGANCIDRSLMCHEMGHALQWFWGPLFPFVIAIPSAIRFWYMTLYRGTKPLKPYDSIWFEHQATEWGAQHCSKFYDAMRTNMQNKINLT